jgi:acyl carrier protein
MVPEKDDAGMNADAPEAPEGAAGQVSDVGQRIIEIVADQLGSDKGQITRETSFVNDLGADSLDTVEIVMEIEDEFDIDVPQEEAEKIQTVRQAIDYVEAHL